MIKIGIVGASNLAKTHIRHLIKNKRFIISGFVCDDLVESRGIVKEFEIPYFNSFEELLGHSDVIDFTMAGVAYTDLIGKAIKNSKHVSIFNPFILLPNELNAINKLLKEANVKAQIGFTERFNPALYTAMEYVQDPTFIDVARLIQFSPQNDRISVIYDLMVKDIDLVLSLVKSDVKKISANAVSFENENPDMVSVRIEFNNGSIANITAGRVSEMNIRKVRIYQNQSYVFVDLYEKWVKLSTKHEKLIDFKDITVIPIDETALFFNEFALSIEHFTEPRATIEHAHRASEIAHFIKEKIKLQINIFSS
jgi:predicted dehydrogenase